MCLVKNTNKKQLSRKQKKKPIEVALLEDTACLVIFAMI